MTSLLLSPDVHDSYMMPLRSFDQEVRTCRDPGKYDKYRLVKVTHYKDKSTIAHEFLVLDIYNSDETSPGVIQLRIERGATTLKPGEGLLTSSRNVFSYIRVTNDKITRDPRFRPADYYCIASLRCPATKVIPLPDVCALFPTLYDGAPNYSLFKNQCYWFCSTFLHCLEDRHHLERMKGEYWTLRGNPGGLLGRLIKMIKMKILEDYRAKQDTDAYVQRGVDAQERAKAAEKASVNKSLARLAVRQNEQNAISKETVNRLLQPSPVGRASCSINSREG